MVITYCLLVFRARTERVRLKAPSHLQLAKIRSIDLVERRVTRVSEVSPVSPPLAVRSSRLR